VANPFESEGEWLRCAFHAHTTNSDGELPPEMLVRHYGWSGFDVLAITDHWIRTVEPEAEGLVVVSGAELDARIEGEERDAHVLALGIATDPVRPTGELPTLEQTVAWVNANGGVPYLAHPHWSGLRASDFERCAGLVGIEAYNAGCELEIGRGLSTHAWDECLEAGAPLYGIATDDSHHPGFDSSLAWIWARCRERSPEAVVEALRDGGFYSSTGPVVYELSVLEDAVEIRCSPARRITLVSDRKRGASVSAGRLGYCYRGRVLETDDHGDVVAARLVRPAFTSYGRLEVRDAVGRVAWTNPLWGP
jgi:hypothetical protein